MAKEGGWKTALYSTRKCSKQFVGNGSYGVVYKVVVDEDTYAIKECDLALLKAVQSIQPHMLKSLLLSEICHPNIVRFIGVSLNSDEDVSIVMEYIPFTLTKCLDVYPDFPQPLQFRILRDVCQALTYLHGRSPKLIHRDISSNNIMLTRDLCAKIVDVGSSVNEGTINASGSMSACPGALVCMPPEAKKGNAYYTVKLDIFSLGIVMIHVMVQKWPIPEEDPHDLQDGEGDSAPEVQTRLEYLQSKQIGPLTGLIVECLQTDFKNRPSAMELARYLEDLCSRIQMPDPSPICAELEKLLHCSAHTQPTAASQKWTTSMLAKRNWIASNLAVDAIRQQHQLAPSTKNKTVEKGCFPPTSCNSAPPLALLLKELLKDSSIAHYYNLFGLLLGLSPGKIKQITVNHPKDARQCLAEVLAERVQEGPPLSWIMVAEALDGCGEKTVADYIRTKYCGMPSLSASSPQISQQTTPIGEEGLAEQLSKLQQAIEGMEERWRNEQDSRWCLIL